MRNLPSLNSLTVTNFPSNSQGLTFRFQIKVLTQQRSAVSQIGYIVLASTPLKPTDKPTSDMQVTNDSVIKVSFANPAVDNGGSPIISYELVIDDGMSGMFRSVIGMTSNSLLTTVIITEGI